MVSHHSRRSPEFGLTVNFLLRLYSQAILGSNRCFYLPWIARVVSCVDVPFFPAFGSRMAYTELSNHALINREPEELVDTWLTSELDFNVLESIRHREASMEQSYSCTDCAAFEFQPENVAPVHSNRNHFLRSQWKIPWIVYVVYRVVVALLFTAWIVADFLDEAGLFYNDNYAVWLVFASNWNFMLLDICAIMHAAIVVIAFVKSKHSQKDESNPAENQRGLSVPLMIFWVLYNCSFNGALVVTMSYWTFLIYVDKAGFLINAMSRLKHTLNTVYVVFDLMFSAMPIRIFHVIYPLCWGAIYTIFNVIYFTNNGAGPDGHPYAYYVMDWRNPLQSALTCSLGFILATLMQSVLYGLYRLRLYIYGRVTLGRYDVMGLLDEELLSGESSASENEAENILPPDKNRTASYSSTDTTEREATTKKTSVLVAMEMGDVAQKEHPEVADAR